MRWSMHTMDAKVPCIVAIAVKPRSPAPASYSY